MNSISSINKVNPYEYNKNSSGYSNNFYMKNDEEENFEEILNEELKKENNLKNVSKGLMVLGKYNDLYSKTINDLSYPVKYASIPVYYVKKDDIIIGYIASKCFIVNETINIKYRNDVHIETNYDIVCPFNGISIYQREAIFPIFENNECINSIQADKVFDNYKEAKDESFRKNRDLNISNESNLLLESYEEYVFLKTKNFKVDKKLTKKLTYNTK